MIKSTLARSLGALIIVLGLLFGLAAPASAATSVSAHHVSVASTAPIPASVYAETTAGDGPGSDGVSSVCPTGVEGASTSSNLPVNRWTDATAQLFWRLSNVAGLDTALIIQRQNVLSLGMSTGNTMWAMGTGLAGFALNFCILNSMGGAADHAGKTIGTAIAGSGLLAGLLIVGVFMVLLKGARRGSINWKAIAQKGVVLGIFYAMIVGATASTGGGMPGSKAGEPYQPGIMSPGWVVTTMNNTITGLAQAPAAALTIETPAETRNQPDLLSCVDYTANLRQNFRARYETTDSGMSSGVPLIMNHLWEQTGLQTWRNAQFGTSVRNNGTTRMDDNTWCRLLEFNTKGVKLTDADLDDGIYTSSVRGTMLRSLSGHPDLVKGVGDRQWDSPSFSPGANKDIIDRSLIAWTACQYRGGDAGTKDAWWIRTEFQEGDKDEGTAQDKYKPENCASWYTGGSTEEAGAFDWSQNGDDVTKRTTGTVNKESARNVRDFVQNLHGNTNTAGSAAIIVYNLAALAMLAVFGLLSLAIIVAKIAMIVMIAMAFFMVIMAFMPNANMDKLTGFLKTLLGMNLFIFAIQVIFALISVITSMLSRAGKQFLGDSEIVGTLWTGFAPLLAVFLINMMFTKVMKLPSPFKLSGAMAWGAAAGAAGGAASAGLGRMLDRKQGQATNAARNAARRTGSSALSKVTGGRMGSAGAGQNRRRGTATPVAPKQGKGGKLKEGAEAPATVAARKGSGAPKTAAAAAAGAAGGATVGAATDAAKSKDESAANETESTTANGQDVATDGSDSQVEGAEAQGSTGAQGSGADAAGHDEEPAGGATEDALEQAPDEDADDEEISEPESQDSADDTHEMSAPVSQAAAPASSAAVPSGESRIEGHDVAGAPSSRANSQNVSAAPLGIPLPEEESVSAERSMDVAGHTVDDSIDGAAVVGAAAAAGAVAGAVAGAASNENEDRSAAAAEARKNLKNDHATALRLDKRHDKLAKLDKQAGGLSPEDFMHQRVANSKLADGTMARRERSMLNGARKIEAAAAARFDRDRRIANGAGASFSVKEAVTHARENGAGIRQAAKAGLKAAHQRPVDQARDNMAKAWHDFKAKPFATTKKGAGKVLKYSAITVGVAAAFPFGIGVAATAGVAAGAYALHKTRKHTAGHTARVAVSDQRAFDYRAHMRGMAEKTKAEAVQNGEKVGADGRPATKRQTIPAEQTGSGEVAKPVDNRQKVTAVFPAAPVSPSRPTTSQMPIVEAAGTASAPVATVIRQAAPAPAQASRIDVTPQASAPVSPGRQAAPAPFASPSSSDKAAKQEMRNRYMRSKGAERMAPAKPTHKPRIDVAPRASAATPQAPRTPSFVEVVQRPAAPAPQAPRTAPMANVVQQPQAPAAKPAAAPTAPQGPAATRATTVRPAGTMSRATGAAAGRTQKGETPQSNQGRTSRIAGADAPRPSSKIKPESQPS